MQQKLLSLELQLPKATPYRGLYMVDLFSLSFLDFTIRF